MFSEAFKKVEQDRAQVIVEMMNKETEGIQFDAKRDKVMESALSFYPGFKYYEATNLQENQPVTRVGFYKSGSIYMLDWTNEPIYRLNLEAPIALDESNVANYVKFFFSHVRGEHGQFFIVENIDDIAWKETPPPAARQAIGKLIEPVTILDKKDDGDFDLVARMTFKDSLFKSDVHVKSNGLVSLSNEELVVEDMPIEEG